MGLFLFNDVLVLSRRTVRHLPFTLLHRSTHTFQACVAVGSLAVREIADTRCESRSHRRPASAAGLPQLFFSPQT